MLESWSPALRLSAVRPWVSRAPSLGLGLLLCTKRGLASVLQLVPVQTAHPTLALALPPSPCQKEEKKLA